jgi:hypoxanthine phosphoribosyltransferase
MPIVRNKKIEVLFAAEAIARRNRELAEQIALSDLSNLVVISILKGSFVFAADLIRALHAAGLAPEVEFMSISSYGAGTVPGTIRLLRDIDTDVRDRDVLLIDDILESGNTLRFARNLLAERGARRIAIAVLLDKKTERRKIDVAADFVAFQCPDKFVVGYGMDVAHAFRELPFVGVVAGDA